MEMTTEFLGAVSDREKAQRLWDSGVRMSGHMRYALLPLYPWLARTTPDFRLFWLKDLDMKIPSADAPADLFHHQVFDSENYHNYLMPLTLHGLEHIKRLALADHVYELMYKFVIEKKEIVMKDVHGDLHRIFPAQLKEMFWHYFEQHRINWDQWRTDVFDHGVDGLRRLYGLEDKKPDQPDHSREQKAKISE
jgi:hypothetical protein